MLHGELKHSGTLTCVDIWYAGDVASHFVVVKPPISAVDMAQTGESGNEMTCQVDGNR